MQLTVECPTCGSEMQLRTARRGRNAGNQFWGCSQFPRCRGTRDVDAPDDSSSDAEVEPVPIDSDDLLFVQSRVLWNDTVSSPGWDRVYTIGGGSLRSVAWTDLLGVDDPPRRLAQVFMATYPAATVQDGFDPAVRQVTGTFRKILQRGDAPPLDPEVERALLNRQGVVALEEPYFEGDLSFAVADRSQLPAAESLLSALHASASDFVAEDGLPFDSHEEGEFFAWVQQRFGPTSARWLYPQASLDRLLEANNQESTGFRRLDFLFAPPWQAPTVIEVDGAQHAAAQAVDDARDDALEKAGIPVVRIAAGAVRAGELDRDTELVGLLTPPHGSAADGVSRQLLFGPAEITRLGLALAEGIDRSWLKGAADWHVRVEGMDSAAVNGFRSLLEMLGAVDELWAGFVAPTSVTFHCSEDPPVRFERIGVAEYASVPVAQHPGLPDLTIRSETDRSPLDGLPRAPSGPTVVIRSSTLPVRMAEGRGEGVQLATARDPQVLGSALERVLQFVFAKKAFREGQEEALISILTGHDAVVLLPTGAGKSLVYQMAGLLLPGRTLIVDPIVALVDDQVASLRNYGIDRAVGLSSAVTRRGLMDRALDLVRRGDALYFFVAPERLQQEGFRNALRALTMGTPINLAVVDEAHCVSEWGHDFRPAYLGLGPLLRELCRRPGGTAPPLISLTGTASRAVLRDVMIELELDRRSDVAIIKPDSFDRPELSFDVIPSSPGAKHSDLEAFVRNLPERFGVHTSAFFAARGRSANLGLVFCPHVNGEYGIVNVRSTLERIPGLAPTGVYSGGPPRGWNRDTWEFDKRRTALAFREGDMPALATTKAFGMGIDIPNIRYTVHFGIPGSIESFYQEAGRAGRDRLPARCAVLFTETSSEMTRALLGDDTDADQARIIFEGMDNRADDVLRMLWFHFNSFPGRDAEKAHIEELVEQLLDATVGLEIAVPFGAEEKDRERAIYRLQQVGLVRDYLKDWGSRTFRVILADPGPTDLDEAFLEYVQRVEPGQRKVWAERVDNLPASGRRERRAGALASLLIEVLYETIERSRRRALRELVGLLRNATGDDYIRRRIEDYFREGEIAPILQAFLEEEHFDIDQWTGAFGQLSADEAGELRGATARYLESYPDHPGLLLGRALAEAMSGGDAYEFEESFDRALEVAGPRYNVPSEALSAVAVWMLEQVSEFESSWGPLVWRRIYDRSIIDDTTLSAEQAVLEDSDRAGESMVILNARLGRMARNVNAWSNR